MISRPHSCIELHFIQRELRKQESPSRLQKEYELLHRRNQCAETPLINEGTEGKGPDCGDLRILAMTTAPHQRDVIPKNIG